VGANAEDVLMGDRETKEIEKAIAEFLRKLEVGKKDMPKPDNRGKPAR